MDLIASKFDCRLNFFLSLIYLLAINTSYSSEYEYQKQTIIFL